jgi:sortase A
MKSKTGIILMLAGGAAIIFSLIIIAENIRLDSQGKKNSENVLNILESEISSYSEDENNITYTDGNGLKKSKTISVDNNYYSGIIDIPEIGIKLPVMSEWNYDNLNISPCLFYNDEKNNRKIIAGHNYSSHFGKLKQLKQGDYIIFTNAENKSVIYKVLQTEILGSTDTDKILGGDDWNLTLFTCSLSGYERVTVRCIQAD